MQTPDLRRFAPATERNRQPIFDVLRRVLPATGTVLEIASGTGEHAAFMAPRLPDLLWQPTDPDPDALASIDAWRRHTGAPNLRPPLALDAASPPWPLPAGLSPAALFNANMIHIAPWAAALGLFAEAGRLLAPGAPLVLYGPFCVGGAHTAPSNAAFDESLRARDPAWGVRDRLVVAETAARHGLLLDEIVEMPANNLILVFRRAP
jgi:SAM-dependent methyltransferase